MMQDLKARLGGLALIALGSGLGWFFILEPLRLARLHAHDIHYSIKAFLAVPACLIFGCAFLLLGSRFRYRTPAGGNFTPTGCALFIVVVAVSGAGFWWFQQEFGALGYTGF